jgi:hypothetical protein
VKPSTSSVAVPVGDVVGVDAEARRPAQDARGGHVRIDLGIVDAQGEFDPDGPRIRVEGDRHWHLQRRRVTCRDGADREHAAVREAQAGARGGDPHRSVVERRRPAVLEREGDEAGLAAVEHAVRVGS